jgi:hypothetical protein
MTTCRTASRFLAAGLVALVRPAAAQEPRAQVQRVEVVVPASSASWVNAGLAAAPGDLLVVTADGRVTVTPGDPVPAAPRAAPQAFVVTADGVDGTRRSDGTLELALDAGSPTPVGAHDFVIARDSGSVRLRVRSSHAEWNSGSFRVEIIRVPAALMAGPWHRGALPGARS